MPTGQATPLLPTLRRLVLARQSAARSDGDLLGAFVNARDAEAFAELVRRHGPMVLGVCRRVVGDRSSADDAFQASFLVLARRAASVRPREQVGNWLYGVAYRTALKARTVLARRRTREKQVDVMPEPAAPTAPAWTDLHPIIDEELAKLPDKLRVPVVLCDLEGRTQRDVARHLNVPAATLATRLASARRTLAARLTRRGVTLSGGALAGLLGTHAAVSAVPPALAGGAARAAEAVATGAPLHSLVSANAVHLSEGVMRMMMLAKLKAAAVTAVTVLALTTGLGLGLVPAAAGDHAPHEAASGPPAAAKPAPAAAPAAGIAARLEVPPAPGADDATFLRRLCLDVRGTPPTDVETFFFVSDDDDDKRAKVADWMTDDDAARAHLAKKLGLQVEHVKVVRARVSADGRFVELKLATEGERVVKPVELALTADGGKVLLGKVATTVVSEAPARGTETRTDVVVVNDDPKANQNRVFAQRRLAALSDATGKPVEGAPAQNFFRVWDVAADDAKSHTYNFVVNETMVHVDAGGSDAEFLKRVLTDVRGNGPTALELKYFTEDKDPKKREKLIDTLLKEPAVQKKLGDAWKAKMLALRTTATFTAETAKADRLFLTVNDSKVEGHKQLLVLPLPPQPPVPPKPPAPPAPQVVKPFSVPLPPVAPQTGKLEKLVTDLVAAKKSDEAILEALTLATQSRLPTDSEKKLTLAVLATAADRKAAWVSVAKALSASDVLVKPGAFNVEIVIDPTNPPKPPVPPVPPARP